MSGPALVALCEAAGLEVSHTVVSDDREAIAAALRRLADDEDVRFVFTTGGTGLTPDDVTPEATRDVIDREAPGYAESIRADSREHTPLGILTRGVSGVRGRTLIVNFPGNPKAIEQSWPVVEPTLRHAAPRSSARALRTLALGLTVRPKSPEASHATSERPYVTVTIYRVLHDRSDMQDEYTRHDRCGPRGPDARATATAVATAAAGPAPGAATCAPRRWRCSPSGRCTATR